MGRNLPCLATILGPWPYNARPGPSLMSYRPLLLVVATCLSLASAAAAQQPVVSFSASSYSIPEKDSYRFPFVVVRTGDLDATVNFQIRVTNVRTNKASGFATAFPKGSSTYGLSMSFFDPALDNTVYDSGRKYVATLEFVTGGTIGTPSSAEIDIIDDELPPQVTVSDITVSESTSTAYFHFALTTALAIPLSIPITFHDGMAKAGIDYQTPDTFAVFPAGTYSDTIAVTIVGDTQPEGDESFTIELGTPSDSAVILAKSAATCTILDDDGAVGPPSQQFTLGSKGVIRIRLSEPAPAPETVLLQVIGNVTCPSAVEIPAGSSSADIEIGATETGLAAVNVTLPPSRGGRTFRCDVLVFDDVQLSLDPIGVTLAPGAAANVMAKIDPPPRSSFTADVKQTNAAVAEVPSKIAVQGAETVIPVRGKAVGVTEVTVTLTDAYNYRSQRFVIDVRVPPGLAITSLSQSSGRASGGETVKIF